MNIKSTTPTVRERLDAIPYCMHGGTYLVMVRHHWGRGPVLDLALLACRKNGGKTNRGPLIVYWQSNYDAGISPDMNSVDAALLMPYVDDLGRLVWRGKQPKELLRIDAE